MGRRQCPLGHGCPDWLDAPTWVTLLRTLIAIYEVFSLTFEAHKIPLSARGAGIRTPRMVSAVSKGERKRWEYQPHEPQSLEGAWEPWRHAQPGPLPGQGGMDDNTR